LWSVDPEDEGFAGQERLYEVLGEEFLKHSLEGYNCCIFACPLSIAFVSDGRWSNWIWKNSFNGTMLKRAWVDGRWEHLPHQA